MMACRGLVALACAGTVGCYGGSLDVGGFAGAYATPSSSENSTAPPPAPLPKSFQGWPSTYDGMSFSATARIGSPDAYGYGKEELAVAHSTGEQAPLVVGDASITPRRTTLTNNNMSFGGGFRSHGFNVEAGFGLDFFFFDRTVAETDGHGHAFAPIEGVTETGFTVELTACHGVVELSSALSMQLCGHVEPSALMVFGRDSFWSAGIVGGIALRLAYAPTDAWPPRAAD